MRLLFSLAIVTVSFLLTCSASAMTLIVNGGILLGARNVDVSGSLYRVEFIDGFTCAEVFTGCDDLTDFPFTTETDAVAASAALAGVFVDVPHVGQFDSNPDLTLGCSSNPGFPPSFCLSITPFAFALPKGFRAAVFTNNVPDGLFEGAFAADFVDFSGDTLTNGAVVYARWTPEPVPEPASVTLLGVGLVGMGVRRWRQRKQE